MRIAWGRMGGLRFDSGRIPPDGGGIRCFLWAYGTRVCLRVFGLSALCVVGEGVPSRRADQRGVDGCLLRAFRGRIPAAANHVPTVSSTRRRASRGGRMDGLRFDSGRIPPDGGGIRCFLWAYGTRVCLRVFGLSALCVVGEGVPSRRADQRGVDGCLLRAFRGRIPAAANHVPTVSSTRRRASRGGRMDGLRFDSGRIPPDGGGIRCFLWAYGTRVCLRVFGLSAARIAWGKGSPLAAPTGVALTAVCGAHSGEGFPLLQTMCPRYHPPGGAHRVGEGWTACVSIRGESRRTVAGFAVYFYGRMGRGFVCVRLGYLRCASRGKGSPLAAPTSVALTAVCCAHSGEGFPLLQTMCPRYHPPGGAHRVGEGWAACVSIRGESRRTAAGFAVFLWTCRAGDLSGVRLGGLRASFRGTAAWTAGYDRRNVIIS